MTADGFSRREVLTPAIIQQINDKINEAARYPYAEVVLVLKRGELRYIRSAKSEPPRVDN